MLMLADAERLHARALGLTTWSPPTRARRITLDDYHRHVQALLREHAITVTWSETPVRGARAFAECARRHITCPPITDDESFATVLHEIGHVVSEVCAGPRHYRDPAITDWWNCLGCEVNGWTACLALIHPMRWSLAMHRSMIRRLKSYRRRTPGWPAVVRELDALATEIYWFEMKQREVQYGTVTACRATLTAALNRR